MASLIGQRLDKYEVVALLGKGGMAAVYRARQASMDRDVAIKVIKPDLTEIGDFVTRFQREARTVASLSHANILKVFDYGQQGDLAYLVMELLPGGSLAEMLDQGPLPLDVTSQMLDQIASALDYAHRKGIIHRDLKPQNVLLDDAGNAHLTDFGIAKILSETMALTQSGAAMGTPAYMSPEQWQGQALDARADVYALGVMLFEMLTGQLPFAGDTPASIMYQHLQQPPPPVRNLRADLPPGFEAVIGQALAKDRDDRFASAGDLAAAFKSALVGQTPVKGPPRPKPVDATQIETPVSTPAPARSRRPLLVGGALVIALLLIGGLVILSGGPGQPTQTSTAPVVAIQATTPATMTARAPTATSVPPTPTRQTATLTPTMSASATDRPNPATLAVQTVAGRITLTANAIMSFTKTPTSPPTVTPNEAETINAIVHATDTAVAIASFTKTPTSTVTPTNTPTTAPTVTDTQVTTPTNVPPPTAFAGGGRIVFSASRLGRNQLFLMNPDGSDIKQLTNLAGVNVFPLWSPDGKQIVFFSNRDGNEEIYVINADGSGLRRLTNNRAADRHPHWSPDGKLIVFASNRDGGKFGIFIMDVDGANARRLSSNTDKDDDDPTFSPDGKYIIFGSQRDNPLGDLYRMDADGTNLKRLTNTTAFNTAPAVSPDSQSIAFVSNRDGNLEIYVMGIDGSNVRRLTSNSAFDGRMSWSPDGLHLVFESDRDGDYRLFVMDVDGSNAHRIGDVIGGQPSWSR